MQDVHLREAGSCGLRGKSAWSRVKTFTAATLAGSMLTHRRLPWRRQARVAGTLGLSPCGRGVTLFSCLSKEKKITQNASAVMNGLTTPRTWLSWGPREDRRVAEVSVRHLPVTGRQEGSVGGGGCYSDKFHFIRHQS